MDETLRRLQKTLIEILRVIDAFCRENGIKYSLYAGTLLGAIRHEGFIPWDDDLDICMERSDYERFIAAWEKAPPKGYLLQNKMNSPSFPQSFTKIRKEHTTFLQHVEDAGRFHTGVFVDIFPIDRLPDGAAKRVLFLWDCARYQLLTREFVPPKGNAAEKLLAKFILLSIPPARREAERTKLLKRITASRDPKKDRVGIETIRTARQPLPADLMDSYISVGFEGEQFLCFQQWDAYLTVKFGDYMTLPPEEERTWKHYPIILDFEHDYEELKQLGQTDRLP